MAIPDGLFDSLPEATERPDDAAVQSFYDAGFDALRFVQDIKDGVYCVEDKETHVILPWGPLLRANKAQQRLLFSVLKMLEKGGPCRMLVLKGRRVGASTGIINLIVAFLMQLGWKASVVAHSDDSAKTLLGIARTTWQHMPPGKPDLYKDNEGLLQWGEPKKANRLKGIFGHQASLSCVTAKGTYVHSGGGYSIMLYSEAAKYTAIGDHKKQQDFILSSMGSVSKTGPTLIIAETTANGTQGWFPTTWTAAVAGKNEWVPHFISYLDDATCQRTVPSNYDWANWLAEDKEKEEFLCHLGAKPAQLYFRRHVLENDMGFDFDAFDQEFPATPTLAFRSSGRRGFPKRLIESALTGRADPLVRYNQSLSGSERGVADA